MAISDTEKHVLNLITSLQAELKQAQPMAGIVLMDLLKSANELHIKIENYQAAK